MRSNSYSFTLFAHASLIFPVMVTRKYTIVLFDSHTQQETIHKQKRIESRERKEKDLHNSKNEKKGNIVNENSNKYRYLYGIDVYYLLFLLFVR